MDMMETALVVDNDFLMRGYAVESLQREGIHTFEASSIEEAHRLLAGQRFDLVFADIEMFGTGREASVSGQDAIHIVMTSFRNVEKATQLIGNVAYDYLVKPFSTDQVSIIVSRTRELFKLRAQIEELQNKMGRTCAVAQHEEARALTSVQPAITNLQDLERQTIIRVLNETCGSRSRMAEKLGISVRTLRNKLTQYKQETSLPLF
ncbi:helix-turn-helix domain-containing protein [Pontiellaceae bacterium B1224]|nr:helix-turn-helix domain-containing protein [Pontiellaceae bacterium B1224]